ncbi:hypothetical protein F2P45_31125 [Massilia sp. CCM 8733]|uniref:Uncharacterized protein n=1 Tax=Massilia mucilaginosa TaxID=2609282 RepID=A0ABX0P2F0_9BURK|nr:hypothetical protein [Massilia mucilaginosa]
MGRPAGRMCKLTERGALRLPGAPSHRRETRRRFCVGPSLSGSADATVSRDVQPRHVLSRGARGTSRCR